MKRSFSPLLLLFGALLFWAGCQKSEYAILGKSITFRDNVLTCESCAHFGYKTVISGPNLVVTDWYRVYWFEQNGENWEFRQVLSSPSNGRIASIDLDDNTLCFGFEYNGSEESGRVIIYELKAGKWEEVQTLYGISGDYFGSLLAVDGDHMVVRASANNNGVIHFFHRMAGLWVLAGSFQDEEARAFGYVVALEGDYAYISSFVDATISVYAYDGRHWAFKEKWPDIRANNISIHEGTMIIRPEDIYNEPGLLSFDVEDGEIIATYPFDFDLFFGGDMDMKVFKDRALVPEFPGGSSPAVWQLRLVDGVWTKEKEYIRKIPNRSRFGVDVDLSADWAVISHDLENQVHIYPI